MKDEKEVGYRELLEYSILYPAVNVNLICKTAPEVVHWIV
jgi:hypothetical protein